MGKHAYTFVPLKPDGRPSGSARYTHITTEERRVGDVIEGAPLLGFTRWQVVEVRVEAGPLLGTREASGADIPLAGTIVCRGVREAGVD